MRLAARCRQLTGIDAVNRPLAACGALSAQLRSITHSAPGEQPAATPHKRPQVFNVLSSIAPTCLSGVWQHSVRLHRRLHVCASAAAAAATNGDASAAHAAGPSTSGASSESSSGSPRVCVLGGGFGGLYTAIKLESLIWPKGKKPRVSSSCVMLTRAVPQTPAQLQPPEQRDNHTAPPNCSFPESYVIYCIHCCMQRAGDPRRPRRAICV